MAGDNVKGVAKNRLVAIQEVPPINEAVLWYRCFLLGG